MKREAPHNRAVADTDFLVRPNTRWALSALAEMTESTLVLGPVTWEDEIPRARRKAIPGRRQQHEARQTARWRAVGEETGFLEVLTYEAIEEGVRSDPAKHTWMDLTWMMLQGDTQDRHHVETAFVAGASTVLTGNMRCIDTYEWGKAAQQVSWDVPEVMKCDLALDYFARRMAEGTTRQDALEQAILSPRAEHPDFMRMWAEILPGLAVSFRDTCLQIAGRLKTSNHEKEAIRAHRMQKAPQTQALIEASRRGGPARPGRRVGG